MLVCWKYPVNVWTFFTEKYFLFSPLNHIKGFKSTLKMVSNRHFCVYDNILENAVDLRLN